MDVARRMVREPREAAGDLVLMNLSRDIVLTAFLAVTAITVIATAPMVDIMSTMLEVEPAPPLVRAVGSGLGGLAFVWVFWKLGGMMGGVGKFDHIFAGIVVLEALLLVGTFAFLLLLSLIPAVAGLAGLAGSIFWLWMVSQVLAEIHGFPSAWKAFGVMLMSWISVQIVASSLVGLVSGIVGGPSNV